MGWDAAAKREACMTAGIAMLSAEQLPIPRWLEANADRYILGEIGLDGLLEEARGSAPEAEAHATALAIRIARELEQATPACIDSTAEDLAALHTRLFPSEGDAPCPPGKMAELRVIFATEGAEIARAARLAAAATFVDGRPAPESYGEGVFAAIGDEMAYIREADPFEAGNDTTVAVHGLKMMLAAGSQPDAELFEPDFGTAIASALAEARQDALPGPDNTRLLEFAHMMQLSQPGGEDREAEEGQQSAYTPRDPEIERILNGIFGEDDTGYPYGRLR